MKRSTISTLLLAGVGLLGAQSASAVSIGFSPATPSAVTTGSIYNVDIVVSDLGTEVVAAYDLDITYDFTLLNATGYSWGGMLGDWNLLETINNDDFGWDPFAVAGIVDLFENSLLSDAELFALQAGGPVTLATITFEAIADGTMDLGFIWDQFNDVKGRDAKIIIPGTVPEPATLLLMAAGIAGLGYSRRKQCAA